jgi:hypothetical protein
VTLQFTAVLLVPLTLAVSVTDCAADTEAVVGDTEIETGGTSDTTALSLLVESAALVAVTVTVWAEAMVAGAV